MCGGTAGVPAPACSLGGLSPRVRGNPMRIVWRTTATGSIPACAGEPRTPSRGRAHRQVYPRVCGGTAARPAAPDDADGLSPRVRGNRSFRRRRTAYAGSIPACAGEPPARPGQRTPRRVYPRVCGGTSVSWQSAQISKGLSPRVRGNPGGASATWPAAGSIPACAGEPEHLKRGDAVPEVYPRVCGGTAR